MNAVSAVSMCQMFPTRLFHLGGDGEEDVMLPETLGGDDPFESDLQPRGMSQDEPAHLFSESITGAS